MKIAVLAKYVPRGDGRRRITAWLKSQGIREDHVVWMGCAPSQYDGNFNKTDLKEFRDHFAEVIDTHPVGGILCLGNEALYCATGHSGIMNWRGKVQWTECGKAVMPTLALGAVDRNPSQTGLLLADIRSLVNTLGGVDTPGDQPTRDRYTVVDSRDKLVKLINVLAKSEAVAFDLETDSFEEMRPGAFIVSMSLTTLRGTRMDCWAIPLCHRASRWSGTWRKLLGIVLDHSRRVPIRVAHNGKFDCRWLVQFDPAGIGLPCNWDTMLAAHLLDENRRKGLKELAQIELAASEWDINIKDGKTALPWYEQHPLKDILWYNALDTWHTMRLYSLFSLQLRKDDRLHLLFQRLLMPASQSLVHIERAGVYVHTDMLEKAAQETSEALERIHGELNAMVPTDPPYPINWNASNFARWFLFDYLELPVLARGKSGLPSMSESVLRHLAEDNRVAELLLERVKWQKFMSGFINPYREQITDEHRIHTTFKLHGTVTGRLASGKGDADKVTGAKNLRGVNLQQVPRDPLMRSIFGSAPGWTFVEADYSQIELRIAAEISREPTMLHLYRMNEDIHMTMAMRMTGKPASEVTKEERKKAKAVNFGFLYGMGWRKFIETAYDNYGLTVTEDEAQAFRRAFFDQFPELLTWHRRQRLLAHKYRRVQSPLGRIRHLPDIVSPDPGVVAEAERQAINSPVQAMASDLCLLSLVLLDRNFRKAGISGRPIGTVHDAINFEIRDDDLPRALPLIKQVMERPPIKQLFGVEIAVPIVSDIAVGRYWGTKQEIPPDIIHTPRELRQWLGEHHD